MERKEVSQDDLQDVMEMTQKLEKQIAETLNGNEKSLAMSALIGATINSMIAQCRRLEDVVFYRTVFVEILDSAIKDIKIN